MIILLLPHNGGLFSVAWALVPREGTKSVPLPSITPFQHPHFTNPSVGPFVTPPPSPPADLNSAGAGAKGIVGGLGFGESA